ncbi:MAG: hypothetical protein JNL34_15620 [Anaerolineae bacterium]|nr:hypothetical protein [Anaerolineae bacterium]
MTITAGWYKDYRDVVLMAVEGQLVWDEAFRAQDEISRLLSVTGDHPCALIMDFPHEALNLPHALSNGRTMMARRHHRLRQIVLVSRSPFTRMLGNTFTRFLGPAGGQFEVCLTLDDAKVRLAAAGYLKLKAADG